MCVCALLTIRNFVREGHMTETSQIELFLNSVPILSPLSREEKLRLVDALEEVVYPASNTVIKQGEPGDLFYIIKEGEAVVFQNTPQGLRKVNHLFRADFFGERALLCDEPRSATFGCQVLGDVSLCNFINCIMYDKLGCGEWLCLGRETVGYCIVRYIVWLLESVLELSFI